MKHFIKFLIFIFILILIAMIILGTIGFVSYSNALKEKPLLTRTSEIFDKDNYVPFDEMSKDYINAVISVEDKRYYEHGPIDFIGIARAIFVNLKNGELREGGSTITQQVAKNLVFSQDDTLSRKLGEVFAAYDLEKNFSKEEIFALYVNSAYFGDGYYGIYEASMEYYNKLPKDLNLD